MREVSPETRMTSGMQRRKGNDPALQGSPEGQEPEEEGGKKVITSLIFAAGSQGFRPRPGLSCSPSRPFSFSSNR